ncbi:hypothetical protein HDU76_005732, partial [Blyttiomyces sp. JEL0837]
MELIPTVTLKGHVSVKLPLSPSDIPISLEVTLIGIKQSSPSTTVSGSSASTTTSSSKPSSSSSTTSTTSSLSSSTTVPLLMKKMRAGSSAIHSGSAGSGSSATPTSRISTDRIRNNTANSSSSRVSMDAMRYFDKSSHNVSSSACNKEPILQKTRILWQRSDFQSTGPDHAKSVGKFGAETVGGDALNNDSMFDNATCEFLNFPFSFTLDSKIPQTQSRRGYYSPNTNYLVTNNKPNEKQHIPFVSYEVRATMRMLDGEQIVSAKPLHVGPTYPESWSSVVQFSAVARNDPLPTSPQPPPTPKPPQHQKLPFRLKIESETPIKITQASIATLSRLRHTDGPLQPLTPKDEIL